MATVFWLRPRPLPRIELHTSKVSKYMDVVFRYSLLICSLSIIAVMVIVLL